MFVVFDTFEDRTFYLAQNPHASGSRGFVDHRISLYNYLDGLNIKN